jgi:hypothetical protein
LKIICERVEVNKKKFKKMNVSEVKNICSFISDKIELETKRIECNLLNKIQSMFEQKDKCETLQNDLTSSQNQLVDAHRQIEDLQKKVHDYEVRKQNSFKRGEDGENQMLQLLVQLFGTNALDTHMNAHSGDCIVQIPFKKDQFFCILFDRKNYDQIRLTRTQIDKAIYDANQHKVDAIIVVYNDLPKYAGDLFCLNDSDHGLLKLSGDFDPKKIYVCKMDALIPTIVQVLLHANVRSTNFTLPETVLQHIEPNLRERFENLEYILGWLDFKKIEVWSREFQTDFLRTKRLLQSMPKTESTKKLVEIFESHFAEKSSGNFVLEGTRKRKIECIDGE